MIIRAFRENQTFALLFSFLISVLLWVMVGYVKPYEPDYQTLFNSSLFFLFPGLKEINSFRLVCSAINILFVFIAGIYLSRIAFKFQLLSRRTLLPLVIFLIITLPYFVVYSGLSYALLSITLILRMLDILFMSLGKQKVSYGYFDAALLISFCSIFNFYTALLVVFLIFVLIQFKGLQWRELLFIIIGMLVPYIIFIAMLYIINMDINAFFISYKKMFSMRVVFDNNLSLFILGAYTLFLLIIGTIKMMNSLVKMKILTRKYSIVFFGLFLTSMLIAVFYPVADRDIIFYVALPLSYLFGYYFANCRVTLVNQVMFLLLIGGNILFAIYG